MTSELRINVIRNGNSCELLTKTINWITQPENSSKATGHNLGTLEQRQQPPPPGSSGIPHRSRFVPLSQRGALGSAAPVLKLKIHP